MSDTPPSATYEPSAMVITRPSGSSLTAMLLHQYIGVTSGTVFVILMRAKRSFDPSGRKKSICTTALRMRSYSYMRSTGVPSSSAVSATKSWSHV